MMKTILFLTRSQFGYQSDYFYYCKYLSNHYNIHVLCINAGKEIRSIPKVKVHYLEKRKGLDQLSYWNKAIRLHNIIRPELTVINLFPMSFVFPFIFGRDKTLYDIRSGGVSLNPVKRWIKNKSIKLNCISSKNVSIISDSLAKAIGLNKKPYTLLPLGSEVFSNTEKITDALRLLYIGTLNGRNLAETIIGFSMFRKDKRFKKNSEYHIIGDGHKLEEKYLRDLVVSENLSEYVFFHGRKSHAEAQYLFDNSTVGVSFIPIKNHYQAQPPTKTYEYLCSGLVVIATETHENSRVINDKNGILIKDTAESFFNALGYLSVNLSNYSPKNIMLDSQKYTWENITKDSLIPVIERITTI